MHTHLRDQKFYEDMYERHTVEFARRDEKHYEGLIEELRKKTPKGEKIGKPGGEAMMLNLAYMQFVGDDLLRRYENRARDIEQSMAKDQAKDDQIAA